MKTLQAILIEEVKLTRRKKMKFSIKYFFSKCDQILNGKLHFLCSVRAYQNQFPWCDRLNW